MNGTPCIHTKVTKKGALEISTSDQYLYTTTAPSGFDDELINVTLAGIGVAHLPGDGKYYSSNELQVYFDDSTTDAMISAMSAAADGDWIGLNITLVGSGVGGVNPSNSLHGYIQKHAAPNIKIDSGADLKLGGILDFGSSFAFGETDNGIEFQLKKTKKNNEKDCGILKVHAYNNHESNTYTVDGYEVDNENHTYAIQPYTLNPGRDIELGSCSVLDIIKFVNWAKATQFGPWGTSITTNSAEEIDPEGVRPPGGDFGDDE